MQRCIAQTGRWPDASADIAPDELDDFIAHAEACPYHATILRAEEEKVYAVFRAARALSDDGRALGDDELRVVIAEHERRESEWETAGGEQQAPGALSLHNGARLVVSLCEFHDFVAPQALYELDPRVGLQIRARCGADRREKVLLGFYDLWGDDHHGDELLLPLGNGYTVGLRVEKDGHTQFRVGFRCVRDEVIARARRGAQPGTTFGATVVPCTLLNYPPEGGRASAEPWMYGGSRMAGWQVGTAIILLMAAACWLTTFPFSKLRSVNHDATGGGGVAAFGGAGALRPDELLSLLGATLSMMRDAPTAPPTPIRTPSQTPARPPARPPARTPAAETRPLLPPDITPAESRPPDAGLLRVLFKPDAEAYASPPKGYSLIFRSYDPQHGFVSAVDHRVNDPILESVIKNMLVGRRLSVERVLPSYPDAAYRADWNSVRQVGSAGGISVEVKLSAGREEVFRDGFELPSEKAAADYEFEMKKLITKLLDFVAKRYPTQVNGRSTAVLATPPESPAVNDDDRERVSAADRVDD